MENAATVSLLVVIIIIMLVFGIIALVMFSDLNSHAVNLETVLEKMALELERDGVILVGVAQYVQAKLANL